MKTSVARWPCLALALLAGASGATAPRCVALAADEADDFLAKARGLYSAVGEAFGYPLYRRDCDDDDDDDGNKAAFCTTKFLYRSGAKGLWTLTGSSANVERGRGAVVSTVASDSPVGVGYKVFRDGHWTVDASVQVTDATHARRATSDDNGIAKAKKTDAVAVHGGAVGLAAFGESSQLASGGPRRWKQQLGERLKGSKVSTVARLKAAATGSAMRWTNTFKRPCAFAEAAARSSHSSAVSSAVRSRASAASRELSAGLAAAARRACRAATRAATLRTSFISLVVVCLCAVEAAFRTVLRAVHRKAMLLKNLAAVAHLDA